MVLTVISGYHTKSQKIEKMNTGSKKIWGFSRPCMGPILFVTRFGKDYKHVSKER